MCVEAIASYIKAEDPSYYAEVTKKKEEKKKDDNRPACLQ